MILRFRVEKICFPLTKIDLKPPTFHGFLMWCNLGGEFWVSKTFEILVENFGFEIWSMEMDIKGFAQNITSFTFSSNARGDG